MRVREYLQFRGKLRRMSPGEREKAVASVTERCWLREFVDRPISQLSKGMRQRVGLADAIMHNPEVLILDEPTLGLDPNQIRETRNLIKELGEGHTVLLSSHILHEVEQTCSRTIIIAEGRIVASGSTKELREQFDAQARVIAEMRGPLDDVEKGVGGLEGVQSVEATALDGWVRLAISPKPDRDIREDIFRLTADKGWSLREIRREGGTLEDFFVKVTAQQQDHRPR
jgi:ABC-2 type transport system ATP-binding protein